jgi:hypothetical protein
MSGASFIAEPELVSRSARAFSDQAIASFGRRRLEDGTHFRGFGVQPLDQRDGQLYDHFLGRRGRLRIWLIPEHGPLFCRAFERGSAQMNPGSRAQAIG